MTQLSKLWMMAYEYYMNAEDWKTKAGTDFMKDMEDTLQYWWTRASCERLKSCYEHLKTKIEARKRLPK